MPIVENTAYRAPALLGNPHAQTIFPNLFRRIEAPISRSIRIDSPDGDFLDLELSEQGAPKIVILSHGLEGSADAIYMRGMAKLFFDRGWDVLRWNFRGCGSEPNRKLHSYHSGASHDLRTVVDFVLNKLDHQKIALIGFSVGGNITLKYLGEEGSAADGRLTGAVCLSVPCHLRSSSELLAQPRNRIYMRRFLKLLRGRLQQKAALFPGQISLTGFSELKTFLDYDNRYTAPLNGFRDAYEYWEKASSINFLRTIELPTLILSAGDDHFLAPQSYPSDLARNHAHVHLETPAKGGHVGFVSLFEGGAYWSELRALDFLDSTAK